MKVLPSKVELQWESPPWMWGNQPRGCGSELNQNRTSKLSASTWLSFPDYTVWAATSWSSCHHQSPTMTASALKLWAQCHKRRPISTHINISNQQSRFCFVLFCFVFFWSQILEVDQEGNIGAHIWKALTEYLQSSKLSRGLEDIKNTVPNILKQLYLLVLRVIWDTQEWINKLIMNR